MLFPVVEVTRSLSNLIKYTFVNFDKEDSYVIDYEKKEKPVEEPELQMTQVPDPEGFEAAFLLRILTRYGKKNRTKRGNRPE